MQRTNHPPNRNQAFSVEREMERKLIYLGDIAGQPAPFAVECETATAGKRAPAPLLGVAHNDVYAFLQLTGYGAWPNRAVNEAGRHNTDADFLYAQNSRVENPAGREHALGLVTLRPDGRRQSFSFADRGAYWESVEEIPEPHAFTASLQLSDGAHEVIFAELAHDHPRHEDPASSAHRDNNIRSAYIHVMADAAVSILAITGLVLARSFGWLWMDPLAGIIGALVIANWSYGLVRDTGSILLDMNPDQRLTAELRALIERDGDRLVDLHLWRLGPGHLGALVSVLTGEPRDCAFYRARLKDFKSLSHVTVEVLRPAA